MKRRQFISLLGGAAPATGGGRGQQAQRVRRVGIFFRDRGRYGISGPRRGVPARPSRRTQRVNDWIEM
jgi:hypothetical protein